jgi:hypothetical protein
MDLNRPRGDGPRRPHPGDDRRSAYNRGPEIIAAEERILLYADGLLSFMRSAPMDKVMQDPKVIKFLTHEWGAANGRNPFGQPLNMGESKQWLMELMDPDNNRLFAELLRAAWDLRCWRQHYGEITPQERDHL